MLQPKAYRDDCAELVDPSTGWFGTIGHHFTAFDFAKLSAQQTARAGSSNIDDGDCFGFLSHGDVAFRQAWLSEYGSEYPDFAKVATGEECLSVQDCSAQALRLKHVNWWQGNETLKTLVDHVTSTTPEVLVSDAALAESLQDYSRYLYASLNIATALAPGAAIDLCWHTHQTNPVRYAADMRRLSEKFGKTVFMDHVPCGEENPPQPEWMYASMKAWQDLFGPSAQLPRGVGAMNDSGCCCCSAPDPEPETPAQRARAEMELEQAKAAKRQEMTRILGLPPDQLDAEAMAKFKRDYAEGCLVIAVWLLVLGVIFVNGNDFFRWMSGVLLCLVGSAGVCTLGVCPIRQLVSGSMKAELREDYLSGDHVYPQSYKPYPNGITEDPLRIDIDSAVSFVRANDRWEVVEKAELRAARALDSHVIGELERGEIIENLETRHDGDIVRIRCDRGWTSVTSRSGDTLLRPMPMQQSAEVSTDNPINGSLRVPGSESNSLGATGVTYDV
jgi:translation initiation factor 1 (eIF-1/SUI1)